MKWNESKNLVNLTMCDRDLAVCNTSKCEEEKTKEEISKNGDVNLTTEANIKLIDQRVLSDKSPKLRNS